MLQENDDQKDRDLYMTQFSLEQILFIKEEKSLKLKIQRSFKKNRIFNSLKMKFLNKMVLFIFFVACSQSDNFQYNGVVVTRHHLASDVGATIFVGWKCF